MSILFVGSYTEMITTNFGGHGKGIYTLELKDRTGELKLLHTTPTVNAGYVTISKDQSFLYTIKEVFEEKNPVVRAFKINPDYSLQFLNEQPILGSLPCHIVHHDKSILIACYGTGNVLRFQTHSDGSLLNYSHNFKHSGSSINSQRQESPHAHQIAIHPNKKLAFVPDLGIDKVKVYSISDDLKTKGEMDIDIPKGLGPRHMVFNETGTMGYVINELTAEVSILKKEIDQFIYLKNVKSLPDTFTEVPGASAIRIHPNQSFLYVANRTLDAITIFQIVEDSLVLIDYQFTNGTTLREFNISSDGKWLIACLQDSDETIVYQIVSDGTLLEKHRTSMVQSGVCIAFL